MTFHIVCFSIQYGVPFLITLVKLYFHFTRYENHNQVGYTTSEINILHSQCMKHFSKLQNNKISLFLRRLLKGNYHDTAYIYQTVVFTLFYQLFSFFYSSKNQTSIKIYEVRFILHSLIFLTNDTHPFTFTFYTNRRFANISINMYFLCLQYNLKQFKYNVSHYVVISFDSGRPKTIHYSIQISFSIVTGNKDVEYM